MSERRPPGPRKPRQEPSSRSGGELPYKTGTRPPSLEDDPTEGTDPAPEEPPEEYRTSGAYTGAEDEDEGAQLSEPSHQSSQSEEEDIYGEDDELPDPERDGYIDEAAPEASYERTPTRHRVRRAETSILAAEELERSGLSEDTHVGRMARLEITRGPDKGRSKRFNGVRMVIGRAEGVDLRLTDASVSRRHIELVSGDSGVLLRDLGSGNGTRLNGEKVMESALKHGDEIALGKTVLRFVDPVELARLEEEKRQQEEAEAQAQSEAAAQAAEAAPEAGGDGAEASEQASAEAGAQTEQASTGEDDAKSQAGGVAATGSRLQRGRAWVEKLGRKQKLALGGAVVVGVGCVVALGAWGGKSSPATQSQVQPSQIPVFLKLEAARTAMVAERFSDALRYLTEAEKMRLGSDSHGLANAVRNELEAREALDSVRALMKSDQLVRARDALADVPEASAKVEAERAQLEEELSKLELEALEARFAQALKVGDIATARELIQKFPLERRTDLISQTDQAEEKWNERRTEAERRAAQAREAALAREKAQRRAFMDAAFAAVERKFDAKDYERAILECDRVLEQHGNDSGVVERARALKSLIPAFVAAYEDADRKLAQGATETSVRPLRRARGLYERIGFGGPLAGILDAKLASAALAAGRGQFAREDFASAQKSFREALKLNPREEGALEGLALIQKAAESLYKEAASERDRDPRGAIIKLRTVLRIASPDSVIYRQARSLLSELKP